MKFSHPILITVSEVNDRTVITGGIINDASLFLENDDLTDAAWEQDDEPVLRVSYTVYMAFADLPGECDAPSAEELDEIRELIENDELGLDALESGRYALDNPYWSWEEEHYTPSSTMGDYGPGNPWDAPGMSIRDFL